MGRRRITPTALCSLKTRCGSLLQRLLGTSERVSVRFGSWSVVDRSRLESFTEGSTSRGRSRITAWKPPNKKEAIMAVSKYEMDGKILWQAYVNVRSKENP